MDNRPFIAFVQNQMAKKEAKEAALDNYFRDLGKNITPTGMRSQDVEGLTKRANEWRQFYAQNKDAIHNPRLDNGKSYTEYMSRYQDQLGYINQSKNELKTDEEFNKIRLDPNRSYILDDPDIINKVQRHSLSLDDPNRQSLNVAEMAVPPKPWDVKDLESYSKYLTAGLPFDEIRGKTEYMPGFKTRTPITKQYSPTSIQEIGTRAMTAYDTDRSLQFRANKLAKEIESDPQRHNELNQIFKNTYGVDADSPRELLAAQAILDENKKSIKVEEGKDEWGMAQAVQKMKDLSAEKLLRLKKDIDPNDTELNNTWVDQYLLKRVSEARSKPPYEYKYYNGIKVNEYNIPVDPVLGQALSVNGVQPNAIRVDDNGNFRRIFYKRYEEGDEIPKGKKIGDLRESGGKVEVDEILSRDLLTTDQMALALGYRGQTKKDLGKTMADRLPSQVEPTKKKYTINGITYTHEKLRTMYPEEKIREYIDAGIIK